MTLICPILVHVLLKSCSHCRLTVALGVKRKYNQTNVKVNEMNGIQDSPPDSSIVANSDENTSIAAQAGLADRSRALQGYMELQWYTERLNGIIVVTSKNKWNCSGDTGVNGTMMFFPP